MQSTGYKDKTAPAFQELAGGREPDVSKHIYPHEGYVGHKRESSQIHQRSGCRIQKGFIKEYILGPNAGVPEGQQVSQVCKREESFPAGRSVGQGRGEKHQGLGDGGLSRILDFILEAVESLRKILSKLIT